MNTKHTAIIAAVTTAAAAFTAASVVAAPASAEPVGEGCHSDFWMWHLRSASRIICDGERNVDGAWVRRRGFFDDAYYTNAYSSCYRYGCTYYPSRYVPELEVLDTPYVLTDDTIPGGEPGWTPSAEPRVIWSMP